MPTDAVPPSTAPNEARVAEIAQLVRATVDEPWIHESVITAATAFQDDLELESIEFVALAEALQARYGERVDFVGWVGTMTLDQLVGLTVGDVAGFLEHALAASDSPAAL